MGIGMDADVKLVDLHGPGTGDAVGSLGLADQKITSTGGGFANPPDGIAYPSAGYAILPVGELILPVELLNFSSAMLSHRGASLFRRRDCLNFRPLRYPARGELILPMGLLNFSSATLSTGGRAYPAAGLA